MYFESELVRIGENLPNFKIRSGSLTLTLIGKIQIKTHSGPEKIFQCPECGLRFIHFTSFMKVCGKHVRELRNVSSTEGGKRLDDKQKSQDSYPKMIERPVNIKPTKLPLDYFFFCKLCHSITRNYEGYRDHIKSHEDPSLKHCQVCDMEFTSFAGCKKHKAKFHPEISKLEIEQRKEDARKQKDKGFVYNIIHKSKIILVPDDDLPRLKQESDQIHPKELKIVLEPISLPGFLPNNWISLPKPGSKFPWIKQNNIKSTTEAAFPVPVKEEAVSYDDDDFSWPMTEESQMFDHFQTKLATKTYSRSKRRIETTDYRSEPSLKRRAVMSGDEKIGVNQAKERKLELEPVYLPYQRDDVLQEVVPNVKRQEDSDDDNFCTMMDSMDDDFSWPMDEKMDDESEIVPQKLENVPKKPGRPSKKIRITEPPDIPQYPGAKYLFSSYDKKNSWRNKLFQIRRKLGLTTSKTANNTEKTPNRVCDVTTCQICNKVRSEPSIRTHVATHFYEESETECRICGCKVSGRPIKYHYTTEHKVDIRRRLMKEQQERMEKGLENGSDYVTCPICYTNLKTEEHLKYHKEMLHEYDPIKIRQPKIRQSKNLTKECKICNRTYKDRLNYRGHLRRVHPELLFEGNKTIICDECGKTYNKMGFIQHFFLAHRLQAEPKVCEKCGKTFKLQGQLRQHNCEKAQKEPKASRKKSQRIVKNRIPQALIEADREAHQTITDYRGAYCHVCDKQFTTARGFKNHCRIYDQVKFVCDVEGCDAYFINLFTYKRHKIVHENGFLCKCRFCDTTFNSYEIRRKHERKIHKNTGLSNT